MCSRINYLVGIVVLTMAMTVTAPIKTQAEGAGEDWYCKDHEAHAKYEKHLKRHLDHSAEAITEMLDKVYSDQTLSREEKKKETLAILHRHLAKMNTGIGD